MKKIVMCFLVMCFLGMGVSVIADTPTPEKSTFIIVNDTDEKQIMWLEWVSNPWQMMPVTVACSEMEPGQRWELIAKYPPGVFDIIWRELDGTKNHKKRWIGFRVIDPPGTFYLKHDIVTRSDGQTVEQKSGWEK